MTKYWNEEMETMSADRRGAVQLDRLKATVKRVYTYVKHYRQKMQAIGMLPEDVRSLDDLKSLPFTTKQDLRDTYPFGMFATPKDDIIRIHASSGTTGNPTVVGYTQHDIGVWSEVMARSLYAAGGSNKSVVQVSYGYGLFTGGLGAHYGAELIGASTIPTSGGNTNRQIQIMKDFGSTILCCTPSYALFIAETLYDMGYTASDIKLEAGCFGAEPWTEDMRKEIERLLGIKAHDIYGLSEISGPGVAIDCEYQNGLHVADDHFIPEIINPDTGEPLPDGATGELVFSTITKEGLPLLRYRTRDISSITTEKCRCGRTSARMAKPHGRTDDMLIIRGVNVFPSQIESVILQSSELLPHYMIVVDRANNLDTLEVRVEVSDSVFSDDVKSLEGLERRISSNIASVLNVSATVKLVEPRSIQRSEGKAKRVIDKRCL